MTFSPVILAQLLQMQKKFAQRTIGSTAPTDKFNDAPIWEGK